MSPCARCPRLLHRSCCEPLEGERLATLTRGDVERIARHTGLAARRFVDEEWLTEGEAADYEARRPLFRGYFRARPLRLTLALSAAGACVFHTPQVGCRLPEEVRPLACRLYPFERLADGSWGLAVGRYGALEAARVGGGGCLAVEEAETVEALQEALGLPAGRLEVWAAALAAEAAEHGRGSRRDGGQPGSGGCP